MTKSRAVLIQQQSPLQPDSMSISKPPLQVLNGPEGAVFGIDGDQLTAG
ncbi:hypothetical protein [Paenibacillus jilunlii]|nr:hypothetical protein [Paenibacillus jilunlii]